MPKKSKTSEKKAKGGKKSIPVVEEIAEPIEEEEEVLEDEMDEMAMLDELQGDSNEEGNEYSEDDEEEDDLENISERLMTAIDKFSASATKDTSDATKAAKISQQAPESSYAVELDNEAMTMNVLLDALSNTRGIQAVKKSLADLEKSVGVPKHVDKVVADRAERKITYKGTAKEMDKWKDVVLANRSAKTLDLAHDKRESTSYRGLVTSFTPTTDFEKDIQLVLVSSGANANEKQTEQREIDLLVGKSSLKEIKEKQAELAKVKAMMFYEQMKRHRLNKIKSKAYHKIRNRQKKKRAARNGEVAGDGSDSDDEAKQQEDDEEEAAKRVRERMNLRHQNTGKWARMAKVHGKSDKSLKAAYHESILLGQELTKKINEDPNGALADPASEDESGDEVGAGLASKTARKLKKIITKGEGSDIDEDQPEESSRYGKLLNMDFMKQAKQKQKERALEEAQGVLRQLRELEQTLDGDSDNEESVTSKRNAPFAATKVPKKELSTIELQAAKASVDRLLGSGAGSTGKVMTVANSAVTNSEQIRLGGSGKYGIGSTTDQATSWMVSSAPNEATNEAEVEVVDVANPWLASAVDKSGLNTKKAKKAGATAGSKRGSNEFEGKVFIQPAVVGNGVVSGVSTSSTGQIPTKKQKTSVSGNAGAPENALSGPAVSKAGSAPAAPGRKPLLSQKSQNDLVQIAFAGPNYEEEFNKLKDAAIDDEVGIVDKRAKILKDVKAGWGDWAVPGGAAGASQKTLNKRDRLLSKLEQESAQKRETRKDTRLPGVMFSERRIKGASKFKVTEIPHPFTSIEEYERSLQMPLGEEWNASHVVRTNTKPEILVRPGRVIETIKLDKKRKANQ